MDLYANEYLIDGNQMGIVGKTNAIYHCVSCTRSQCTLPSLIINRCVIPHYIVQCQTLIRTSSYTSTNLKVSAPFAKP